MRCDKQVKWTARRLIGPRRLGGPWIYICPMHIHLYTPLKNWMVLEMSEGETMGCEHEITLDEWARQVDAHRSSRAADKILNSLLGVHLFPEDAQRIKDAADASTIVQRINGGDHEL